jgi:hypothetical protein
MNVAMQSIIQADETAHLVQEFLAGQERARH